MLILFVLFGIGLFAFVRGKRSKACVFYPASVARDTCVVAVNTRRFKLKPPWVKHEVIRLKALMPDHGCRKIADVFNRLFQSTRNMTVG